MEIKVTEEMIAAFLQEVDGEAFELAAVVRRMGITPHQGLAILQHVMDKDILRLKCIWVPAKKK